MTSRYCSCGRKFCTEVGAFLHFDSARPGCREISPSEWRQRYDTDTRRTAS